MERRGANTRPSTTGLPRPSSAAPAAGASRFGFPGATAGASRVASSMSASTVKRTASAAGLGEAGASRRVTRPSSSLAASQRSAEDAPPGLSAEIQLEQVKTEAARQVLVAEQSYAALEAEFVKRDQALASVERQKRDLLREWEGRVDEMKEMETSSRSEIARLNSELSQLRKTHNALATAHLELQKKSDTTTRANQAKIIELTGTVLELQGDRDEDRAAAESYRQSLLEQQQRFEETERQLKEDIARQASSTSAGDTKLAEELHRQTSYVTQLEAKVLHLETENRKLRASHTSIEVLKEEKRGLESKVKLMDETRSKLAEAEFNLARLESEKQEWSKQLAEGSTSTYEATHAACVDLESSIPAFNAPSTLDPSNLPKWLSTLRGAVSGLTVRASLLSQRLERSSSYVAELEREIEQKDEQLQKASLELNEAHMARMRAERLAQTTQDETNRVKAIFATYEQDAANQSGTFDTATAQRIEGLEQDADKLREEVNFLMDELDAARAQQVEARLEAESAKKLELVTAEVETLRSTSAALERECERLGAENDDIWRRYMGGEHSKQLRVVELLNSPLQQQIDLRKAKLAEIQADNERLLERIAELEANGATQGMEVDQLAPAGAGAGAGGMETEALSIVKELRTEVATLEKRMLRLKQAFDRKASEFRGEVLALFGFKFHWDDTGSVELKSTYARSKKGTKLRFRSDPDDVGAMTIVGEARNLPNFDSLKTYWIEENGSVPCFLAALQLELYESTTRAQVGKWVAPQAEQGEMQED